jgi:hypothetical protein
MTKFLLVAPLFLQVALALQPGRSAFNAGVVPLCFSPHFVVGTSVRLRIVFNCSDRPFLNKVAKNMARIWKTIETIMLLLLADALKKQGKIGNNASHNKTHPGASTPFSATQTPSHSRFGVPQRDTVHYYPLSTSDCPLLLPVSGRLPGRRLLHPVRNDKQCDTKTLAALRRRVRFFGPFHHRWSVQHGRTEVLTTISYNFF